MTSPDQTAHKMADSIQDIGLEASFSSSLGDSVEPESEYIVYLFEGDEK